MNTEDYKQIIDTMISGMDDDFLKMLIFVIAEMKKASL